MFSSFDDKVYGKTKTTTTAAGRGKSPPPTRGRGRGRGQARGGKTETTVQLAAKKRKREDTASYLGLDASDGASSSKKPKWKSTANNSDTGTTTTTYIAKKRAVSSTNLNVKRDLPTTYLCNGQLVDNSNQMYSGVRIEGSDIRAITPYFSKYVYDRNGNITGSHITHELVAMIKRYGRTSIILGCIAWISGGEIIEALSQCKGVSLIVNREDFSKYGVGSTGKKYAKIPRIGQPFSQAFAHIPSDLSSLEPKRKNGKSSYTSVRAFGNPSMSVGSNANNGKSGLEHCKYMIFFESRPMLLAGGGDNGEDIYEYKDYPAAVWTGSMNMTKNSESHHENTVLIESDKIAMAYYKDFSKTFMVSTPVTSSTGAKTNTPSKNITF